MDASRSSSLVIEGRPLGRRQPARDRGARGPLLLHRRRRHGAVPGGGGRRRRHRLRARGCRSSPSSSTPTSSARSAPSTPRWHRRSCARSTATRSGSSTASIRSPNHKYATISAKVAYAAHLQGKFWEMHDLLFENQDEWVSSDDPRPLLRLLRREPGPRHGQVPRRRRRAVHLGLHQAAGGGGQEGRREAHAVARSSATRSCSRAASRSSTRSSRRRCEPRPRRWVPWTLTATAYAGFVVSAYLTIVHYRGYVSPCYVVQRVRGGADQRVLRDPRRAGRAGRRRLLRPHVLPGHRPADAAPA